MDASNLAIIALITALVQAIKQIPTIEDNKRWLPTISTFFGLIFGILAGVFWSGEISISQMIFQGIIYGLSSCGLYSSINQVNKEAK